MKKKEKTKQQQQQQKKKRNKIFVNTNFIKTRGLALGANWKIMYNFLNSNLKKTNQPKQGRTYHSQKSVNKTKQKNYKTKTPKKPKQLKKKKTLSSPPRPKHPSPLPRHPHTPPHLRQSHRSNRKHNRVRKFLCSRPTRSRVPRIFLCFFSQDTEEVARAGEELFFCVTAVVGEGGSLVGERVRNGGGEGEGKGGREREREKERKREEECIPNMVVFQAFSWPSRRWQRRQGKGQRQGSHIRGDLIQQYIYKECGHGYQSEQLCYTSSKNTQQ